MAPEVDEPVPDPAPLGRVRTPELEPLLLPMEDEPAPEPELLGNIRPPELEVPLLPAEDEPVPEPELLGSASPVDCESPVPDAEPGVGLPQVRTIPTGEETPGSSTAGVDPRTLKESGPSPASIARGSSNSKAVRVDGCVFLRRADRMAASLLDLSENGPHTLLRGRLGEA